MKKEKIEELKTEEPEMQWDIKRIIIGGIILFVFLSFGALMLIPGDTKSKRDKETLGVSSNKSEEVPPLPDQEDVQKVISDAQEALSEITTENITSSDSAIQKIINDLERIKNNKNAFGAFCSIVCGK